jgi:alpha-tubulin suppressor-like RCC1 family protein
LLALLVVEASRAGLRYPGRMLRSISLALVASFTVGCASVASPGGEAREPSIAPIPRAEPTGKAAVAPVSPGNAGRARAVTTPQIAAGAAFACGLSGAGRVFCWGANDRGQLGITPSEVGALSRVVQLPLAGVVQIAAGAAHACALLDGGAVSCWGANDRGQLGLGFRDRLIHAPEAVPGLRGVRKLADNPLCAVLADDSVSCWGEALAGTAGEDAPLGPELLPEAPSTREVLVGEAHGCLISRDAEVHCWGDNRFGQSGSPRQVSVPGSLALRKIPLPGPAARLAGRLHSTCAALDDSDEVHCWGTAASSGGLADRPTGPTMVRGLDGARQLTADQRLTCALRPGGTVACWGDLLRGGPWSWEIDHITPTLDSPTDVPGVGNARALATGSGFSCALRGDGAVVCWGSNEGGVAGMGSASLAMLAPRVVPGVLLR